MIGAAFRSIGMRREPPADALPVCCRCMARTAWTAWMRAGDVGAGAGLGSGRLSRAASAVTREVPRPGRWCLWGA